MHNSFIVITEDTVLLFYSGQVCVFQGGPDQELKKQHKYGFQPPIFAPGFDDPGEGMRQVEEILFFLNETLTQQPEEMDKGMSDLAHRGIGHLCSILEKLISIYNRDIFNSLKRLQELIQEKEGNHDRE